LSGWASQKLFDRYQEKVLGFWEYVIRTRSRSIRLRDGAGLRYCCWDRSHSPKSTVDVLVVVVVTNVADLVNVKVAVIVVAYGEMWRKEEQNSCPSCWSKTLIILPGI
jgi:hypothetical protein